MNDKIKHFIVGAALGVASYFTSWGWGLLVSSLIFFGKETYDIYKPQPTGFDKVDLLSDYLGWCSGWIVSFIIYHLIQMLK